ncbi:outer membrane beta-barrel protein [uncultured Aquimarina sp.]|uniref:outer membrane protein n=1 Tax=uncultured Aquimarina sp. TaxID=575652 RepID=UPI00262A975F|nr:outer membrane beta-barrel protein [uncultured Aquimarina sp.]
MRTLKIIIIAFLIVSINETLFAQEKWSVEIRPGLKLPTKDIGDADLKVGFGFEATIAYNFMEHLAGYAGWGYNTFRAVNSFAGEDADFDETGYTFGLRFIHPIGDSSLSLLARAGGIYNHIEVESESGDINIDSGHGLGWEIGAGLDIDLGKNWSLRPQIGYRSLSRDLEITNTTIDAKLNYISFDMGISKRF